jgi:hypothetical protein
MDKRGADYSRLFGKQPLPVSIFRPTNMKLNKLKPKGRISNPYKAL